MGWASKHIERLLAGETVVCRPTGNSMSGKIESDDKVTIEPVGGPPSVGDIVLCKVRGAQYLRLVP